MWNITCELTLRNEARRDSKCAKDSERGNALYCAVCMLEGIYPSASDGVFRDGVLRIRDPGLPASKINRQVCLQFHKNMSCYSLNRDSMAGLVRSIHSSRVSWNSTPGHHLCTTSKYVTQDNIESTSCAIS